MDDSRHISHETESVDGTTYASTTHLADLKVEHKNGTNLIQQLQTPHKRRAEEQNAAHMKQMKKKVRNRLPTHTHTHKHTILKNCLNELKQQKQEDIFSSVNRTEDILTPSMKFSKKSERNRGFSGCLTSRMRWEEQKWWRRRKNLAVLVIYLQKGQLSQHSCGTRELQ